MKNKCLACERITYIEKHHFKTRGSGGGDDDWNLLSLCRRCHTEIHQIGNNSFVKKYKLVLNWLLAHGWKFCEARKKWKRDLF